MTLKLFMKPHENAAPNSLVDDFEYFTELEIKSRNKPNIVVSDSKSSVLTHRNIQTHPEKAKTVRPKKIYNSQENRHTISKCGYDVSYWRYKNPFDS